MTSSLPSCEVYFIRHGETDWNLQDRIQGHTDIPLNKTGIFQATLLKELLADVPFSAAFSSDLSRAQLTAELVLRPRSIPVKSSISLRERSAGNLEGVHKETFEEKIRPFLSSPQALQHENYMKTPWHPELETAHSVFNRVSDFLLPLGAVYTNQSLLVVSHGGVLRSILDHILFSPGERWIVDNCGFIKIQVDRKKMSLIDSHGIHKKSSV